MWQTWQARVHRSNGSTGSILITFGVANYPDDYESRLVRAFPIWPNLRLWALEPHDLALTKLERSNDRDIRDVMYLAQAGLITQATLISVSG